MGEFLAPSHQELDGIGRKSVGDVGGVPRVQSPHALFGKDGFCTFEATPTSTWYSCLRPVARGRIRYRYRYRLVQVEHKNLSQHRVLTAFFDLDPEILNACTMCHYSAQLSKTSFFSPDIWGPTGSRPRRPEIPRTPDIWWTRPPPTPRPPRRSKVA